MTNEEAIKKLSVYSSTNGSGQCTLIEHEEAKIIAINALETVDRQQAEIGRLKEENQNAVRRFANELQSKFAGHSDYHGDTILTKIICLKEGKEIKVAKPIDRNEIKSEAYKEFAERLKDEIISDTAYGCDSNQHSGYYDYTIKIGDIPEYIDDLLKEMEGK